jgi:hypothetical protein
MRQNFDLKLVKPLDLGLQELQLVGQWDSQMRLGLGNWLDFVFRLVRQKGLWLEYHLECIWMKWLELVSQGMQQAGKQASRLKREMAEVYVCAWETSLELSLENMWELLTDFVTVNHWVFLLDSTLEAVLMNQLEAQSHRMLESEWADRRKDLTELLLEQRSVTRLDFVLDAVSSDLWNCHLE